MLVTLISSAVTIEYPSRREWANERRSLDYTTKGSSPTSKKITAR